MRATLEQLDGPQAPGIVAGLGVELIQALSRQGPTPSGSLHPRDVALDEHGAPVLAPVEHRIDDRLVAPELEATGPTPETVLFGLGVELHRLATGRLPARNPGRPGEPSPPASTWAPDVPPTLDRAIATLLSPEPGRRATALADLADLALPLPDLRLLASKAPSPSSTAPSRVGTVKVTRSGGDGRERSSAVDSPSKDVRHVVVVPTGTAISPGDRSALAGSLGVTEATLTALTTSGLPVPVHSGLRRAEAAEAVRTSSLPAAVVAPAGAGLPLLGAALVGLGALGALVGAALTFVTLAAGLGLAAASLLPFLTGLVVWFSWMGRRRSHARAAEAVRDVARGREETSGHPILGSAYETLSRARVALASADLPAVADADVRSGLARIESELETLRSRQAAHPSSSIESDALALERGLADLIGVLTTPTHTEGQVDDAMGQALAAARLAVEVEVTADDPLERARRAAAARKENS